MSDFNLYKIQTLIFEIQNLFLIFECQTLILEFQTSLNFQYVRHKIVFAPNRIIY